MPYHLLLSRSITHAQRMSAALEQEGFRVRYGRAPVTLSDRGCGYAVRLGGGQLSAAMEVLDRAELRPTRIFLDQEDGAFREVPLP